MIATGLIAERVGEFFPQLRQFRTMLDELQARCRHPWDKVVQGEHAPLCNNCGGDPRVTMYLSPHCLSEAEVANGVGTRNRLTAVIKALEEELQSLQAQCQHPKKQEYLDDEWCGACRKNWSEVIKERTAVLAGA